MVHAIWSFCDYFPCSVNNIGQSIIHINHRKKMHAILTQLLCSTYLVGIRRALRYTFSLKTLVSPWFDHWWLIVFFFASKWMASHNRKNVNMSCNFLRINHKLGSFGTWLFIRGLSHYWTKNNDNCMCNLYIGKKGGKKINHTKPK